jgi:hypothetical protein
MKVSLLKPCFWAILLCSLPSFASTTTVNFDNPAPGVTSDQPINGTFQGINFGSSRWALEGPYGADSTNNIYFMSSSAKSAAFSFTTPSVLQSVAVFAGTSGTMTLSDNLGQTVSKSISAGRMYTVSTGWTKSSTTVTLAYTAGWSLGVDNITYSSGTSTAAGTLAASPTSVSFGSVKLKSSVTKSLAITNSGTANVRITSVSATGTGFSLTPVTTPLTLGAGKTLTLSVQFAPAATGAASGRVTIASNASNSSLNIPLSGTGTSTTAATLAASPASVSFGNVTVNSAATKSIAVSNTGSSSVTVSAVGITGTGFSLTPVSTPVTVAPGAQIAISVKFAPPSTGSATGTLTVTSNASNPSMKISLSGSGISAAAHSVTVSWTASTSAVVGYNVYRSTVSGGPYTKINSVLESSTDYVDTAVTAGAKYYYVVTAVNSAGVEGSASAQVSATVPTP